MSKNQSDFADQHRRIPPRKPSAASESFITALAVLFFISLAVLFQFLDRKDNSDNAQEIKRKPAETKAPISSGIGINSLPSFPNASTENNTRNILKSSPIKVPAAIKSNLSSPPFAHLDIPKQVINVDARAGHLITSPHKSVISIPPFAFLDKNGKIVEGNVNVSYREFYNFMDFFLSGIPMHYDSGDGSQLESAGMFELTASKDNEPVYVNPESRISVMMASLNRSPGYNLYYFDKQQNKWIYKGESEVTIAEDDQSFRQRGMFRDSFEQKFYFRRPDYVVQLYGVKEPAGTRKNIFSRRSQVDAFTFHFVSEKKEVPGLNKLCFVQWRYTGKDARKKYNKAIAKGVATMYGGYYPRVWNNAIIRHQQEDDTYLLTLCDIEDSVSMKIIPKLPTERSIRRFKTNISDFISAQESRQASELERFEKFKKDTAIYFANNSRYTSYDVTSAGFAMRQFQIDGFGIWNCDRPMVIPQAVTVNALFVDENDNPVKPDLVYLADKSINTVFTYYNAALNQFKFNPSAQNLVWALFPGEVMVIIRPEEFSQKYSGARTTCVFKVNLNNTAAVTEKEMKEKLAFDL